MSGPRDIHISDIDPHNLNEDVIDNIVAAALASSGGYCNSISFTCLYPVIIICICMLQVVKLKRKKGVEARMR